MTTHGLVLSGGGPVGIAWEAGVLAGLAEAGADLTGAERIVGTSAGAVVGSRLALGESPARVLERWARRSDEREDAPSGEADAPLDIPAELLAAFVGDPDDAEETRRRVGAFALRASTPDEEAFVAGFGDRLAHAEWPAGFVCTAVDAETGAFTVFDADAGVPLGRAVAASCAVPGIYPPVTVAGRRYMDGGIRSVTNADLAEGCDVVTVLSVLGSAEADPAVDPLSARLHAEVERLEAAAARVRLCFPDGRAREAIGPNPMDARRAAAAGEAGVAQGRAEAARLAGDAAEGR